MEQRAFTLEDQFAFAELSGDYNPMHVDPTQARRLMFGTPVVHGANLVLWAVERVLARSAGRVMSLQVQFNHAVRIGETVRLSAKEDSLQSNEILIFSNERVVCRIKFGMSDSALRWPLPLLKRPVRSEPRLHDASTIRSASGVLPVSIDPGSAEVLAPKTWGSAPDLVSSLASASRLVGIECPGLNSIFSALKLLRRFDAELPANELEWQVRSFDERFSRAEMEARSATADLKVTAFLRPAPQVQPTTASLRTAISPGAYSKRRAVVVGGSRGLGEICAKLLGAGGAEVCLTYNKGKDDAHAVVADISRCDGRAFARAYDVLGQPSDDLAPFVEAWKPTHLYYFATPPIFVATRRFSPDLFDMFCDFYVRGFVEATRRFRGKGPLSVFYPSSVAIDEAVPDMGEYSAAKAAGEAVCRQLEASDKNLAVQIARLPRLPTDQTSTVFPTEPEDPVPLMISILNNG